MDENLVRELLVRIRGFTHVIHERFQQELPPGISMPQMLLMKALIAAGPMTQNQLVDALGLSKGAVSQTVSQLEASGFLERRKDEHDGRLQWVHLTPAAHQHREMLEVRMAGVFADLFQDWADDDARRLMGLMEDMMARAKGTTAPAA